MKVYSKPDRRRSRYVRAPDHAPVTLTTPELQLVVWVAEFGIMTTAQLTLLSGLPSKTVLRRTRKAFDFGALKIIPVPRAALATADEARDLQILFGSAVNLYCVTPKGVRIARECHLLNKGVQIPSYGPTSTLMLKHQLLIGDIHIWLLRAAKAHEGHILEVWKEGTDAELPLASDGRAKIVKADAWAVYRLGARVLLTILEADRSTERAGRWLDKMALYEQLFSGSRIKELTSFQNGRLLVVCLDAGRRDRLADLFASHASPSLQKRVWLADQTALTDLTAPAWRQPGHTLLVPLIPASLIGETGVQE